MSIEKILAKWNYDVGFQKNTAHWQITPPQSGSHEPIPDNLSECLRNYLINIGINKLYAHQQQAYSLVMKEKNIVVATGVASGKSLCYNLPVLDSLIKDRQLSALYLFPTKALANDQKLNLVNTIRHIDENLNAAIYDGDTPQSERKSIRNKSGIILSNPDMLHMGILPFHTRWRRFFGSLKYVVIDEVHSYRGVFGSNITNVFRRLKRICEFYGSAPQVIMTSATIGNPKEFTEKLIECEVELISNDTAAKGEKHFIIYNPPLINEELGIRKSAAVSAVELATELIMNGVQTIVFGQSRRSVEIMVRQLKSTPGIDPETVQGYRSGYLPRERKLIEQKMKNREIMIIVATNALELGIDIGGIDAALITGFPGSVSATWQQAGRAGRQHRPSAAVLICSSNPLDQFIARFPEFFFSMNHESAILNPDNIFILLRHLRCAAYEKQFSEKEKFGNIDYNELLEGLEHLREQGELHKSGSSYYWMSEKYPASDISLRSTTGDNVTLRDNYSGKILGIIDITSSYKMVHPGAVYIHNGISYIVQEYDFENNAALLEQAEKGFYTFPQSSETIILLEEDKKTVQANYTKHFGSLQITSKVIGYRKIKWNTNENLSFEDLEMPETELLTTGFWFALENSLVTFLKEKQLWTNSSINYGSKWNQVTDDIRERDNFLCQNCGTPEDKKAHDVHHIRPFRQFSTAHEANQPSNLITLCHSCHMKAEKRVLMKSGLAALAYSIRRLAPLFILCDYNDINIYSDPVSSLASGRPAIVVYDSIAGGLGLCEKLYDNELDLFRECLGSIRKCSCKDGCPSCTGPAGEEGAGGKHEAIAILEGLLC